MFKELSLYLRLPVIVQLLHCIIAVTERVTKSILTPYLSVLLHAQVDQNEVKKWLAT